MHRKSHTEEARAKISAALTGRTLTDEHKAKISASMMGDNNPAHRPDVRAKCRARMIANNPAKRPEVRAKIGNAIRGKYTGENHPNWQGGISFEPYSVEFNEELKQKIRKRDNHACQECNLTEEQLDRALEVHHIDYDKKNNSPENLIGLCKSCHAQTNYSRKDWTEYFREKINRR